MSVLLAVLAVLTLALFIKLAIEIEIGKHGISQLHTIPKIETTNAPKVTVIVPACNEESSIQAGLSSVLKQDYPQLQVIAIDDRSSDGTGAILDRMAASYSILTVVHVTELPRNWL